MKLELDISSSVGCTTFCNRRGQLVVGKYKKVSKFLIGGALFSILAQANVGSDSCAMVCLTKGNYLYAPNLYYQLQDRHYTCITMSI